MNTIRICSLTGCYAEELLHDSVLGSFIQQKCVIRNYRRNLAKVFFDKRYYPNYITDLKIPRVTVNLPLHIINEIE